MTRLLVTGTDTEIGKTVFAAALTAALGTRYWKPIQSGLDGGSDADRVVALGVPASRVVPEAYRFQTPCSPHRAAELDGIPIDIARLDPPPGPLVIEGAGGVLVPVTRQVLYADLFARWQIPAILVARTALGTINHSLLSIEALRYRGVPIAGIAFVGAPVPDTETTIVAISGVRRLGRLPLLDPVSPQGLAAAFAANFDLAAFA